ncbi:hypothetical protein [Streptomyces sp. AC512_CC834]|uniref:hypothetical protein n=1 Tax=Streptomyces sp. AC512_CC834 TaxID=2823691 RepID=UPI001C263608|nr:hypothetical protein [Streptomyces sp. AC512_CC834]
MNAEPGEVAEFDAVVDALRAVIREQQESLREIDRLSEASFRLWLNSVAGRIAAAAGVSLARINAFIDDLASIAANMIETGKRAYHDAYRAARHVRRT